MYICNLLPPYLVYRQFFWFISRGLHNEQVTSAIEQFQVSYILLNTVLGEQNSENWSSTAGVYTETVFWTIST